MKEDISDKESIELDKIQDDLIIALFSSTNKRYVLHKALERAFLRGKKENNEIHKTK